MSIEFTTARKLIETKILRNKHLIEFYLVEEMILEREMMVRKKTIENLQTKRKLIREINAIEEDQLNTYSLERANEIARITDAVNTLEICVDKDKYNEDLYKLLFKKQQLTIIINDYNNLIPDHTQVTNVKAYTYNRNENCHQTKR